MPPHAYEIRPARKRDEQAIRRLIERVRTHELGLPGTAAVLARLLASDGRAPADAAWVAVAGEALVGHVALVSLSDGVAALRALFVEAAWRGRRNGVADALLGALRAHAESMGVRTLVLDSHPALAAAHRFYVRHGFEEIPASAMPAAARPLAVGNRCFRLAIQGS